MLIDCRYELDGCELLIELKTRRCIYRYATDAERQCVFSLDLLSMVGDPWVPTFLRIIDENNLFIETVEVDHKPWVYDRLLDVNKMPGDRLAGFVSLSQTAEGYRTDGVFIYSVNGLVYVMWEFYNNKEGVVIAAAAVGAVSAAFSNSERSEP